MICYSQQSAADSKSFANIVMCHFVGCVCKRPAWGLVGGSHGGVAVEADVQVVLQRIDRVPGQPLEQHVVETLHHSALHTPKTSENF